MNTLSLHKVHKDIQVGGISLFNTRNGTMDYALLPLILNNKKYHVFEYKLGEFDFVLYTDYKIQHTDVSLKAFFKLLNKSRINILVNYGATKSGIIDLLSIVNRHYSITTHHLISHNDSLSGNLEQLQREYKLLQLL